MSGQAMLIALAIGLAYLGVTKTVQKVKVINHQISCIAKTGHRCPK